MRPDGVGSQGIMAELVRFHAENKLLLMAHSEEGMRSLGRIVANRAGQAPEVVRRHYVAGFDRAMARPARPGGIVNALQHAFGHVSPGLEPSEKARFDDVLKAIAEGREDAEPALALLRRWAADQGKDWLSAQSLLREPGPP